MTHMNVVSFLVYPNFKINDDVIEFHFWSMFKLFEYPLLVHRLLFELDQKRVSGQFEDGPKGRFDHVIINFYKKFGWIKNETTCRSDLPRYLNWTKNLTTAGNMVSYHLLLPTLTGWLQFQPCIRQFLFSRIEKRIVVTDIYIVSENLKMSIYSLIIGTCDPLRVVKTQAI